MTLITLERQSCARHEEFFGVIWCKLKSGCAGISLLCLIQVDQYMTNTVARHHVVHMLNF